MKKAVIFFCIIALVSACKKKPTEPPPPPPSSTMQGTWQGSGSVSGIPYTLNAVLAQMDSTVTGTGSIVVLGQTIPFTVSGKSVYPNVSLAIVNADSTINGTFIGTFNPADNNEVNGLSNVPPTIVDQTLTIRRQ